MFYTIWLSLHSEELVKLITDKVLYGGDKVYQFDLWDLYSDRQKQRILDNFASVTNRVARRLFMGYFASVPKKSSVRKEYEIIQ